MLGLVASALLVACGGSADPAVPATPSPSGSVQPASFVGTLQQYREDEVAHVLKVELRNTGTETVRVDAVRVDWPGLDGTQDATPAYDVPPGVVVALEVPYGQAVCGSAQRPSDPVNAVVTTPDEEVLVPLTVSEQLLERLWELDCRRQAVLDAVDVEFGASWARTTVDGQPVLRGELLLTRGTSTTRVSVLDLDGSVLLTLDAADRDADPLAVLAPGQPSATLVVDVGSTLRCDGHSLGESKKTYVFDVGLDLGDGNGRVDVTLQPPDDVKPQMYAVIEEACGV